MIAHRWLGTDNGEQCIGCGAVLDYGETDERSGVIVWTQRTADQCERAHSLMPPCPGAGELRAHHYVFDGVTAGGVWIDALRCAYGDVIVTEDMEYASIAPECIGA